MMNGVQGSYSVGVLIDSQSLMSVCAEAHYRTAMAFMWFSWWVIIGVWL